MENGEERISERRGQRKSRSVWDSYKCSCCWSGKNRNESGSEKKKIRDVEELIKTQDEEPGPGHLIVLVNGIIGSARDWRFASQRMRDRLGNRVAIHCSVNNSARKTFDGVDVMGKRLANEVQDVINSTPSAVRISFVAHSLGGLVARYAIAELYASHPPPVLQNKDLVQPLMDSNGHGSVGGSLKATIGGLQAENFITLATPHLGSRGPKQLPFLFGVRALENLAPSLAPLFVGQTGKHLFLSDGTDKELPLLRKMVTDCKEGQFLSSLRAFNRRVAYANVVNDHMVGWRTSSIRLKSERPNLHRKPVDQKYRHIIGEEEPVAPLGADLTAETLRREGKRGQDATEEEMVARLTQLGWHRVDVRFGGEKGCSPAHNLIQVKNPKTHIAGMDVIEHIIDKHLVIDQEDEQLDT